MPGDIEPFDQGPVDVHLSQYWDVVVRRRLLVGVCVAVSVLAALLLSLLTRPTYRATVVLDVEPERWTPLDIGDKTYGMGTDSEFIPTQIRMMTGREVAERVVTQLDLLDDPEMNPPTSGLLRRPAAPSPERAAATTSLALRIQKNTSATPLRGTKLVHLTYTASSPKLAADIANALANAYLDWLLQSRYRALGRASQFLAAQIEQIKSESSEKEKQLEDFGRQKDIISVDPHTNVTLQKLESLTKDYTAAVSDRVAKEARYNEVRTASAPAVADSAQNEVVNQLRNEVVRLEQRYAEQVNQFKPEWPAMQQLKAQIDRSRQHLAAVVAETVAKARESARTDYMTALRREESLQGILQTQKAEAMDLTSNAVEYNNLRVEVQTKHALFDTLVKRQAETALSARMSSERESNIRIVESALPGSRFTPSYNKNLGEGLALGLGIGLALAFFLEYMDRSLRSAQHVEQYLKLPTLGIIPDIDEPSTKGYGYGYGLTSGYGRRRRSHAGRAEKPQEAVAIELLPHNLPRSSAAEAYRALRTALLLSRPGGVKSMVVSSAFPGEGKTSTAVNLAVVLGQLPGKGVLLVDADLHKPRLHEVLGVSNRIGLVSVLAQNVPGSAAIVKTSIPGVFVVPAGPASPNPSGLLASEAMRDLLKLAMTSFEYVVVDAPPIFPVADALVLGSATDGVIICTKGGGRPGSTSSGCGTRSCKATSRSSGSSSTASRRRRIPTGAGTSATTGIPPTGAAPRVDARRSPRPGSTMGDERPSRRWELAFRGLVSTLCVGLSLAAFLQYRRDEEGRTRVQALARRFTLDQRRPADAETIPLAPAEDLAAGVFANAVLRDAVEPVSIADLPPALRDAWLTAIQGRDEEVAAARALMLDGIARRPGWAYHSFLLATLTYVADTRRGNALGGADPKRWEPPLQLAAAEAPRDDAIFRFWAATGLERWPPPTKQGRRRLVGVLARAFLDAAFVETHFTVAAAALGRSEALALVPAEILPLRAAAAAFAREHDIEGAAAAMTRLDAAERFARGRDLRRLEERARLEDVRGLASGCARFLAEHPVRERDDALGHADAARVLELWPVEREGDWKTDPRGDVLRFFLAGREEGAPGAVLARAAASLTGIPDDVLARIRLAGGDVRGAEVLALNSTTAGSFAWTPFFVRLAVRKLQQGRPEEAREALERIAPAARDGCDVLLVRRALAHESREPEEERRVSALIASLRTGALPAESWSASGSVSLCLDPLGDTAGHLVVDVVGREAGLVEFGWDGGRCGTLLVSPAGRVDVPLTSRAGRHVFRVRPILGGPVRLTGAIVERSASGVR